MTTLKKDYIVEITYTDPGRAGVPGTITRAEYYTTQVPELKPAYTPGSVYVRPAWDTANNT